jgi:hypothetical protein
MAKTIFKVGDRVWDFRYGWGVVEENNDDQHFPVFVRFDDGEGCAFTLDGRFDTDQNRTLFFAEIPIPKEALERPRLDLKVDDRVLVRNGDGGEWLKHHFAGWPDGVGIRTFESGKTSWTTTWIGTWNEYKLPEDE